jgi:two-component system sensor histidine kinase AlgZ
VNAPASRPARRADDKLESLSLPDFCEAPAVLAIVLIAALLGFVLALARQGQHGAFWLDLARISVFLLWAGLLIGAVLCRTRHWLERKPLRTATLWTLGLMVGTVALLSELVYGAGRWWAARVGASAAMFPDSHARFVLPNVVISAIVGALALRYFHVSQQWRRSVELEARSRLHALQARIRPHFLFNSMNTIAALTRSNPPRAEEAIEDLADLFRASLSDARALIPLHEEIEVARTYQRIEQLRLGSRLRVDWDLEHVPVDALVPSLVLQPLVENAIGHGVEPLPEGGTVVVRGRMVDGSIVFEVENPVRRTAGRMQRRGNRMALDNVRERLLLAFAGRASVDVTETDTQFCVRVRIPQLRVPETASPAVGATSVQPSS